MARETLQIGEKVFLTKKAAMEFFKEMLGRYNDDQIVEEGDAVLLRALIERHPEATHKIGCGVISFYKARTDMPTSCFWVKRRDGSVTDFSYRTCVDAKGKSLYQEFAEACREAVRKDLIAAKGTHFRRYADSDGCVACEVTGETIRIDEAHMDHMKPMTFQVIVETFLVANRLQITPNMLSRPRDAQFATTFTDSTVAERFRQYHHQIAKLRIVKAKANLSMGGKERLRPPINPVVLPGLDCIVASQDDV